jgi:predicted transcriptional regulator
MEHGTASCYHHGGCRRPECRAAATIRNAWYRRQIAYGRARLIDGTGTRRRLEALAADGWSNSEIARLMGVSKPAVRQYRVFAAAGQTHVTTAERVRYLFERCWHQAPAGRYQERARRYAESQGWVESWRWEGIDIDDPASVPLPLPEVGVDEVEVLRLMAGTLRVAKGARSPERAEAIRRLAGQGLSDPQIAARIGATAEAVSMERQRKGIASGVRRGRPSGRAA